MVESAGISLYSNTPHHANALWAWSVMRQKLPLLYAIS